MPKKSVSRSASASKSPGRRSSSTSRGRSPTPKRTLNSVPTPERFSNPTYKPDGLRQRGRTGGPEGASAPDNAGAGGVAQLLKCLLNPSAAKDIPQESITRRILEALSLGMNLLAFYLIVSLNKKLFKDKDKGGYGLKGVATLTFFQYTTSYIMLCLTDVKSRPFEAGEQGLRWLLVVIFALAPLASNMSLMLNPVSTYQLFKLLQTPLLAVVEAVTGFRTVSLMRGLLMLGVTGGVGLAELGGAPAENLVEKFDLNKDLKWSSKEFQKFLESHNHKATCTFAQIDVNKNKMIEGAEFDMLYTSRVPGLIWAAMAVVLASSFKMFTGKLVRRGMTPAQFLKNLLPYSGALLGLYALVMEKATFHELTLPAAQGGLGMHGMMIFGLSGLAAYFVQFSQAVAVGTTSALSHALIGQAKTASMLLLSPFFYGEETTSRQLLGGALAMVCLVLYVYVNVGEMEADYKAKGSASSNAKAKPARGRSPGGPLSIQPPTSPRGSKAKKFIPMAPSASNHQPPPEDPRRRNSFQ
eukprot:Tamp_13915.p1 GENE.Tamp_13915~~Tamp_13915.p1  ORF type:complete len:533 (+),score=76.79 Tamp_13915:22-1599(+)